MTLNALSPVSSVPLRRVGAVSVEMKGVTSEAADLGGKMEKGSRGRSDTSRRLKEAAGFCGIRKEKPLGV